MTLPVPLTASPHPSFHTQYTRPSGATYAVLTPNLKGYETAVASGAEEVGENLLKHHPSRRLIILTFRFGRFFLLSCR